MLSILDSQYEFRGRRKGCLEPFFYTSSVDGL
jgi:hypothetical protein